MRSPVNLLKHSPKISDLTKGDVSVLHFSHIHGKVAQMNRRAHFRNVFDLLTR